MNIFEFGKQINPIILNIETDDLTEQFKNLNTGDFIIAKRYINEEQMLEIPEGHRKGPYLVIGKYDNYLKCLYITSMPPKNESYNYRTLELNEQSYSLNKISYINIAKTSYIDEKRFIKRLGKINDENKKELFKKIEIMKRKGLYKDIEDETYNIPLEAGDIISNGQNYYLIIGEDNKNFQCLKMQENNNDTNVSIIIEGKKYYLNTEKIKLYSKLFVPIRENFIDNKRLQKILVVKQQRMDYLKRKNKISRGSLIRINGIMYYIYGEIGNEWMAFSVIGQEYKKLCHLVINNRHYYTDFSENIKFSKEQKDIEILALATDKEMDKIKDSKKSYIKNKESKKTNNNINKQKIIKKEIQCNSVVKILNTNKDYLYIVILRNQEEIIAIDYYKYQEGKYVLKQFYVEEMEKVGIIENFNLKEVLLNIRKTANGYISKTRLNKIIKELDKNENNQIPEKPIKLTLIKK